MSDEQEFPEESEKTIYERDKTAKEPKVPEKPEAEKPKKPVIKPRKVFQPKKVKISTKKPLEHRTRHILVTTAETGQLLRQTVMDFHNDLANEPSNDPDKEIADYDKVEKFFARLARKYSTCQSKRVGGDLDWIYPNMEPPEGVLTKELRDEILKCEKFVIPEPIQTKLGHHVVLVCESRIVKTLTEEKEEVDPRYQALMDKDNPNVQAPPSSMDIPS